MADSMALGGRFVADASTLIILGCYASSASHASFRLPTGSSGYVVTSGKTLTIVAIQVSSAVAAASSVALGYADNDVGMNSSTAFTNPVWQFGDINFNLFRNPGIGSSGLEPGAPLTFETYFTVPTGKIPCINQTGGSNLTYVTIYGTEA